jgi:hypothetical protein
LCCSAPQYKGNASYLTMQDNDFYNSTTGKSTNSWQAYSCTSSLITICEKPQFLYPCLVFNDPPEPPASPYCLPSRNDTTFCPVSGDSCYMYMVSGTYSVVASQCSQMNGNLVSYTDAAEQLMVEKYFDVSLPNKAAAFVLHG